jgi:uncharacterized protein (TIGR03435 family)
MNRTIYRTAFFALAACGLWAQSTPAAFEVATIKPTAPPNMAGGKIMMRVGCTADPARVDCTGMSLKDMLTRAYSLKNYQVSGPSWIESDRWDVVAKIPDGAPAEKLPEMWQGLVTERFHVVSRKESKDLPIYALIVGKNGAKLTPAEDTNGKPITVTAPDGSKVALGPPQGGGSAFAIGKPQGGAMTMDSTGKMQVKGSTIGGFSDMLSRMMDRPVIDMTSIEGRYDIVLEVSMEDMIGMKRMAGGGTMIVHGGGDGAGGPAPDSNPRASIFSAVQQLGLKLDPRKSPIDMLVVEKAEKPSEN